MYHFPLITDRNVCVTFRSFNCRRIRKISYAWLSSPPTMRSKTEAGNLPGGAVNFL